MNLHNRNRLINQYHNYQQNNNIYNNNALLHNPMFKNNAVLNSPQHQQMIAARMREQENIQNIKRMEELNKILVNMNKGELRDMIIQPKKIKKNIIKEIQKNYNIAKKSFPKTRKDYWNKRTNMPYKNIITEEKHYKKFINKRGKINAKELIVYKTTKADRLKAYKKYDKLKNNIEKHNNELKVIYSLSKETKHKESFDYNHKYKFRIKYNPSSGHKQLRDNKMDHYKKQQRKLEKNKIKFTNIVNALVDDGTFTTEDLQKFNNINITKSNNNNATTINSVTTNMGKKKPLNKNYKSGRFINKSKTRVIVRNKNTRQIRNTKNIRPIRNTRSVGNIRPTRNIKSIRNTVRVKNTPSYKINSNTTYMSKKNTKMPQRIHTIYNKNSNIRSRNSRNQNMPIRATPKSRQKRPVFHRENNNINNTKNISNYNRQKKLRIIIRNNTHV
uniref:Uncharacterized protein n=1 Tax=Mimivirus LCMiAC02 TaxID=2506609 RepID=A0A4D5XF18_9VIRU|nr:MAG: uncharacterized protein LCMiAC02_04390 [Mimivirus LCMiAC02]